MFSLTSVVSQPHQHPLSGPGHWGSLSHRGVAPTDRPDWSYQSRREWLPPATANQMQWLSLCAWAQGRGLLLWALVHTAFHGHAPAPHPHGDHPGEQASQLPTPNEGLLREQCPAEFANWRSPLLQQRHSAGPGTRTTHINDTGNQWCS